MSILEKIEIKNISVGGDCNLFHHGIVVDYLEKKSFVFKSGGLYGIIGEFGCGGAALSCGISGDANFYEGEVNVDEKESTIDYLISNSWYVGNDLYKYDSKGLFGRKPKIKKNTIKEQIEYGVHNGKQSLDFHTIQSIFDLSEERVNRNIEFVSGERWKASAAIGFANGRKIFCYPWMNSKDIDHIKEQMSKTVKCLTDSGCIVILPTTSEENMRKIGKEFNITLL